MAAAIAHEVNQPLTALINYATGTAYSLRSAPGVPREALEAIDRMVNEAHRAADIIRHVRALVARRRIEQKAVDLNALIHNLVQVLSVSAVRGSVGLQVVGEPGLPLVPADRVQIEQVLINLVQNAVEAMDRTDRDARQVVVCTRLDRKAVVISVMDRGHGISPEAMPKLFTPFFTTKPYGMGIGLSLCMSIIEAHGGRLWAENNPEGGAIFRFSLPLDVAAPAPSMAPPEQAPRNGPLAAASPEGSIDAVRGLLGKHPV
jgi:C4-dicarboxylate-specific signal transduction histidine kinase